MAAELTTDELRRYGLSIVQPRQGYRFSLDPVLLCSFAADSARGRSVIDLGSGCGVMPLIMAAHFHAANVVGVEANRDMALLAERNTALNGLERSVRTIQDDILNLRTRFAVSSFDLVLSNPPFRKQGTGKTSPRPGRESARHESTAGLGDFLAAAKYLVKPAGGIFFVYLPSRLPEFMAVASELNLAAARLRMVHGSITAEARIFLVELRKGRKADLTVEPPLVVFRDDGSYTDEAEGILGVS